MLKFLFMGDRHNSEAIPVARVDSYHESCELKDMEIMRIARENNVNAILHPGDFWTDGDKRLSNDFIAKIALRWLSCGIPVIGIAGNHDLIGGNLNSFTDTTSGLLNSLGVFKTIENGEILPFTDGKITVNISGTNYHKDMDKPERLSDYLVKEKTSDYHIHLVHGMLTTISYGKLFRHTLVEQIKDTAADITLCGHDHIGFGIVNYNNKYFINPGAVVRLTAANKELARTVSVVLISIDESGITTELIPLKSAKPSSEVLNREHLESKAASIAFEENIKDGVAKLQLGDGLSINQVLDEIYNRDGIPDHIKNEITASLTSKTKSLVSSKQVAPKDTKIVKIKIHNFQSHTDTEIDLNNHFNVVIGESNQGKTSILRAIRWVAENKPSGKSMVRKNTNECFVELTLESGTIIKRYISGRDNGYVIYHADGTVQPGNTKMVETVQKIMGWHNMPVGEKEDIPLNHMRQGDSWYLIGDKYTSTDRARILGAINSTDGADATIKELEKENGKINEAIKHENVEIAVLSSEIETANKEKEQLQKIREVVKKAILVQKIKNYLLLKQDYEAAASLLEHINTAFNEATLIQHIAKIKAEIEKLRYVQERLLLIHTEENRVRQIEPIVEKLDNTITNMAPKIAQEKTQIDKYTAISTILKNRSLYESNYNDACKMERSVAFADAIKTGDLRNKVNNYQTILQHKQAIARAEWVIDSADNFIKASTCVDTFNERKTLLMSKIEEHKKIQSLIITCTSLQKEVQSNEIVYKNAENDYDAAIQHKIDILQESHVCPMCYSVIDEQAVEQIIEKSKKE